MDRTLHRPSGTSILTDGDSFCELEIDSIVTSMSQSSRAA